MILLKKYLYSLQKQHIITIDDNTTYLNLSIIDLETETTIYSGEDLTEINLDDLHLTESKSYKVELDGDDESPAYIRKVVINGDDLEFNPNQYSEFCFTGEFYFTYHRYQELNIYIEVWYSSILSFAFRTNSGFVSISDLNISGCQTDQTNHIITHIDSLEQLCDYVEGYPGGYPQLLLVSTRVIYEQLPNKKVIVTYNPTGTSLHYSGELNLNDYDTWYKTSGSNHIDMTLENNNVI